MQQRQFVLLQLDESVRFIRSGSLPELRVALLLLDNAAELQLHRWARGQLQRDAMTRRYLEEGRRAGMTTDVLEYWESQKILPLGEERRVLRVFDELLRYVSEIKNALDPAIAAALSHLHRYRNEAHHRGHIREATLRTAVLLFFEINCHMLLNVQPGFTSYGSDEDYSWLEQRFRLAHGEIMRLIDPMPGFIDDIKATLPPSTTDLAATLADNLESRLAETLDALDFVSTNIRTPVGRHEVLNNAHAYVMSRQKDTAFRVRSPSGIEKQLQLSTIEEVAAVAAALRNTSDKIEAFRMFATAERLLEPIEFTTHEYAVEVESYIQLEIDIALGK